jgi:hypothetical protein
VEKFKRAWRLEVNSIAADPAGDVIDPVTELRVVFDVDKADGQQMNHATILIYNMSPKARSALARPMPLGEDLRPRLIDSFMFVRLFAGYDDNPMHIYTGDVLWCHNNRSGADWITQMECYTGLSRASVPAQVSFKETTEARVILESILAPMGISVKYTPDAATQIAGKTVPNYSSSGIAFREADEFVRRYGLAFKLEEENQGLVYDPNSARDPNEQKGGGNTFSPTSGLVNTPRITSAGIELRALLRPNVGLFQRIFVESETVRGTLSAPAYSPEYYISHLRHVGDTHGDEWFTEIEAYYARLERTLL